MEPEIDYEMSTKYYQTRCLDAIASATTYTRQQVAVFLKVRSLSVDTGAIKVAVI